MRKFFPILLIILIMVLVITKPWEVEGVVEGQVTSSKKFISTNEHNRTVELEVGLNSEEEMLWRYLDEGSGFLPLNFFYALKDHKTGKPFIEVLPRFGFVPSPSNSSNLPIGLTTGQLSAAQSNSLYLGTNCAVCHSGMYTYQGTAMVIDGAPNILDFEAFFNELEKSFLKTVSSPSKLYQLIHDLMKREHNPDKEGELFEVHPSVLQVFSDMHTATDGQALAATKKNIESGLHKAYQSKPEQGKNILEKLANEITLPTSSAYNWSEERLHYLKKSISNFHKDIAFIKEHINRLSKVKKSFIGETVAGPGRADSFDAIWDLLVQKNQLIPMAAPVSIPQLFNYNQFKWVHWDGNTSSILERDYAQAIALGASYNPDNSESSVLPLNIMNLELVARKIRVPKWPNKILGSIDLEKAARGKAIFSKNCLSCHAEESLTPVAEVGTDPQRAVNFARLEHDGKSYATILAELGRKVVEVSLKSHNIDTTNLTPIKHSKSSAWRVTNAYHSRPLDGIWASPPYLHNGSVPTLWDLLTPASERPKEFLVGRELDPIKVGINSITQTGDEWVFKVEETGNSNQGHEFGVEMSDEEKWSLIEYLKTL